MGAKIIFHAVNGDWDNSEFAQGVVKNYHESNLRMRARAGSLWIATVDNSYPESITGVSPGGLLGPDGNWIAKIPNHGEHYFVHTVDLI